MKKIIIPKARPIEELIDLCGYGFRSLSYHSDGRWIVKSGAKTTGEKSKLFTGITPQEALAKLVIFLEDKNLSIKENKNNG